MREGERGNSFEHLQQVMHFGSYHSYNEVGSAKVLWLDNDNMLLTGNKLNMNSLREMMRSILVRCQRQLEHKVMKDIPVSQLLPEADFIADDYSDTRNGYSFLTDSRNPFMKSANNFSLALITHHRYGTTMGGLDEDKMFKWNYDGVHNWLKDLEIFKEDLFILVHMCGLPARGTEITDMLLFNTATSRRNIYAFGNKVFTLSTYSKTSSNSENSDKIIPRALHDKVRDLFLTYQALIRPMERYAVVDHTTVNVLPFYYTHIWVSPLGRWNTNKFSSILKRAFDEHMHIEMSISLWRHAAEAIARKHLIRQLDAQPDIQQDIVDSIATEQAGHTAFTSRKNYGIEVVRAGGVEERKLKTFFTVSLGFCIGETSDWDR